MRRFGKSFLMTSCITAISAVLLLSSPAAHARFEWTPPAPKKADSPRAEQPADPSVTDTQSGPLTPDPDEVIPVPVETVQEQVLPEKMPEKESRKTEEKEPPAEDSPVTDSLPKLDPASPVTQEPVTQAVKSNPEILSNTPPEEAVNPLPDTAPEENANIAGFGKNISLVLALRDIVPPHYAYAFSDEKNAGLKVSWRGGKPWENVLTDMLSAHNLAYSVTENNSVYIYSTSPPVANDTTDNDTTDNAEKQSSVPVEEDTKTEKDTKEVVDAQKPVKLAPAEQPKEEIEPEQESKQEEILEPEKPVTDISSETPESKKKIPLLDADHAILTAPEDKNAKKEPVKEGVSAEKEAEEALDKPDTTGSKTISSTDTPVISNIAHMPVIKDTLNQKWAARPGNTLRSIIEQWAKTANVEVEWMSPYDYPINNAFSYNGTFEKAVASLLSQYSREVPRPRGRLYPNLPTGPSVLMIN